MAPWLHHKTSSFSLIDVTNFSYDLCIWLWNYSSFALHKWMKIPYRKKTKDWSCSEKTFFKGKHNWKVNSHAPKNIKKVEKTTATLNITLFCRVPTNHTIGKWGDKLDVSPCPNFVGAYMWRIANYKKHGRFIQPLNKPCNISFLRHVFPHTTTNPPKSQKHKWPYLCTNIKKVPYKSTMIPQHEFKKFSMGLRLWIGLSSP